MTLARIAATQAVASGELQRVNPQAEAEARALHKLKRHYQERIKQMDQCLADPEVHQALPVRINTAVFQ